MSDLMIVTVAVLAALLILLSWRLLECLRSVTKDTLKSSERERLSLLHSMERLMERKDTPPRENIDMSRVHSQERIRNTESPAMLEPLPEPEVEMPAVDSPVGAEITSLFR